MNGRSFKSLEYSNQLNYVGNRSSEDSIGGEKSCTETSHTQVDICRRSGWVMPTRRHVVSRVVLASGSADSSRTSENDSWPVSSIRWAQVPDHEPIDILEVEDIGLFEVMNNPVRFRIFRNLQEPRSVKEVAELFGVPPTRLYYHFNLLEEAGVISVVETRKAGAMLQKVYQVKAKSFRPAPSMARGDHEPAELARITAAVVLDAARVDAEEALTRHFAAVRAGATQEMAGVLTRSVAAMSVERARAFGKRLYDLIETEFEDDEEDGEVYGLSLVFLPMSTTGSTEK